MDVHELGKEQLAMLYPQVSTTLHSFLGRLFELIPTDTKRTYTGLQSTPGKTRTFTENWKGFEFIQCTFSIKFNYSDVLYKSEGINEMGNKIWKEKQVQTLRTLQVSKRDNVGLLHRVHARSRDSKGAF